MRYKVISLVTIPLLATAVILQAIKINALNEALATAQREILALLVALGALSF